MSFSKINSVASSDNRSARLGLASEGVANASLSSATFSGSGGLEAAKPPRVGTVSAVACGVDVVGIEGEAGGLDDGAAGVGDRSGVRLRAGERDEGVTALDIVCVLIFDEFEGVLVPADGVLPRAPFVGLRAGADGEFDGAARVAAGGCFGPVGGEVGEDGVEVAGVAGFEGFGDFAVCSGTPP